MQRKTAAVRLVADSGAVVVVNPDAEGGFDEVTLEVSEESTETPVVVRLDADTADALADAIDEARGRRRRQRGRATGDDAQGGPTS